MTKKAALSGLLLYWMHDTHCCASIPTPAESWRCRFWSSDMNTRGIRNNNPGNIDYNQRNAWQGQLGLGLGVTKPRFARFDTPENGIRALGKLLLAYRGKDGRPGVRGPGIDTCGRPSIVGPLALRMTPRLISAPWRRSLVCSPIRRSTSGCPQHCAAWSWPSSGTRTAACLTGCGDR